MNVVCLKERIKNAFIFLKNSTKQPFSKLIHINLHETIICISIILFLVAIFSPYSEAISTTFDLSYQRFINFFYILYIVIILFYPIVKNYVSSHHLITLCVFCLAGLLYNYLTIGYMLIVEDRVAYVSTINLLSNIDIIDYCLSFSLSPLSFIFSSLVIIIGLATNIYTLNYFKNEADEGGFIFWLNSFVISMLILVLANNFFTLFLGWELIGFTSFFLINFWQNRRGTLKSSFKAFSFNLFSDIFLLGSLVIFYQLSNTSDITAFLITIQIPGMYDSTLINLAICLLLGCASIKSVQILGHLWLPDSMEAPVPASALIHSATLVSAGIYLLMRFNVLLVFYNWMSFIALLGSITAAYGGVVAAAQTDMKKLLAYSTMSHCGFLLVLVSFNNIYILSLYLFLHGLYKASTFFCAGSFIRIHESQDTRVMGGAHNLFLIDSILLIICASNLCGLPFMFGALYKAYFLKCLMIQTNNFLVIGFLIIGLSSSIVYYYRLVYYAIFDIAKWTHYHIYNKLETSKFKFKLFSIFPLFTKTNKNTWYRVTLATLTHLTATIILVVASLWTVCLFILWTSKIDFELDLDVFTNFIPTYMYANITNLYTTYLLYFYVLYTVIVVILTVIAYRKQFYWFEKLNALILLINIILWGSIIFIYLI